MLPLLPGVGSDHMTKDIHQIVHLSRRDWSGLLVLLLAIVGATLTSYLSHDRVLTEIVVRQEYISQQQEDIKRDVERLEQRLEGNNHQ